MFKSYEDLHHKVKKWWIPLLQSYLSGEPFLPKGISTGTGTADEHKFQAETVDQNMRSLWNNSKNATGKGYDLTIVTKKYKDIGVGTRSEPKEAIWHSPEDVIHTLEKEKDWKRFITNVSLIREILPELEPWMRDNCKELTVANRPWEGLLNVCHTFLDRPRPDVTLREVAHTQDTKFMENNAPILRSLLDFLIPEHIRDSTEHRLEKRYYLRYAEKMVSIRFLDKSLAGTDGYEEKQILTSDFTEKELPGKNILITENHACFRSLPELPSTLAILRYGGIDVKFLQEVPWLKHKQIYYWGDIDEHGFDILHRMRDYGLTVTNIMMDLETYFHFKKGNAKAGKRVAATHLPHLTSEEDATFQYLQCHRDSNRLEQEKIPHAYALQQFNKHIW